MTSTQPGRDTGTLRLPPHRRPVPTRTRLRTRRLPILGYVVVVLAGRWSCCSAPGPSAGG